MKLASLSSGTAFVLAASFAVMGAAFILTEGSPTGGAIGWGFIAIGFAWLWRGVIVRGRRETVGARTRIESRMLDEARGPIPPLFVVNLILKMMVTVLFLVEFVLVAFFDGRLPPVIFGERQPKDPNTARLLAVVILLLVAAGLAAWTWYGLRDALRRRRAGGK